MELFLLVELLHKVKSLFEAAYVLRRIFRTFYARLIFLSDNTVYERVLFKAESFSKLESSLTAVLPFAVHREKNSVLLTVHRVVEAVWRQNCCQFWVNFVKPT